MQQWRAAGLMVARPFLRSELKYSLRGAVRSYTKQCMSALNRPTIQRQSQPAWRRAAHGRLAQLESWLGTGSTHSGRSRFYGSYSSKAGPTPSPSGYLVPLGIVGGVAAYLYIKQRAP
ncbi:hypothetical protein GGH92_009734, partial [Coemansia sp. RSA 2673]